MRTHSELRQHTADSEHSSGAMDESSGKGSMMQAHRTSGVVIDIATFKVSHAVGVDIHTTALQAKKKERITFHRGDGGNVADGSKCKLGRAGVVRPLSMRRCNGAPAMRGVLSCGGRSPDGCDSVLYTPYISFFLPEVRELDAA